MTINMKLTRLIWGCLVALAPVSSAVHSPTVASGAGPVQHAHFEPDYEASGFISPAGMPSPEVYYAGVQQAGFFGNGPIASQLGAGGQGPVAPVGYCDDYDGGYGPGPMGHHPGMFGGPGMHGGPGMYGGPGQGYDPAMGACGPEGCGCGGGGGLLGCGGCFGCGGPLQRLRGACLFCRGAGCGVCTATPLRHLVGAIGLLRPYGEAGIAAQRWYDLSADVMFLNVSNGTTGAALTSQGIDGPTVLRANSGDDNGMTAGGRISGAFVAGPGGNLEVTYLGGNRWEGDASVTDPNFELYSFLSDFGSDPDNGFDDTDRSELQSVSTDSTFHSGEVNYRRRTVGPYGRFQGSWLGGIRYLRFDNDFEYFTRGALDNSTNQSLRFFDLRSTMENEMVGAQIGGDLWWNVIPGINAGIGLKGGPMGNRMVRASSAYANSLGPGGNPGLVTISDHRSESVWMGEIEATLLYRLSHSWTLKTQYYLLNVDEVAYGFDTTAAFVLVDQARVEPIRTRSLTISGISIGAEYVW